MKDTGTDRSSLLAAYVLYGGGHLVVFCRKNPNHLVLATNNPNRSNISELTLVRNFHAEEIFRAP